MRCGCTAPSGSPAFRRKKFAAPRTIRDTRWSNERLDFRDGLDGSAAQIRPQPTVVAGTDGRLWFATTLGVAWLDPSAVPRNPTPPPVAIRRLAAGAKSWPAGPDLRLPIRTTNLRIEYTALSLSIPDRVRFRYRLTGSDTGWTDAGERREAFYTNLGPGTYRFQVAAANEDGVWNEQGAAVDFTIPPAITQTRWFLLVWVAALGALIWLAYLARVRQVAAGLRVRYQAGLAERARIAHELHDTLLQGFTGITIQLRAIERLLAQRPAEGAEALKNVLASADTTLRQARHTIWDLRAVELEGHDLAGALETAARATVAGTGVELVFAVRGEARRLPVARGDDRATDRPRGGAQCGQARGAESDPCRGRVRRARPDRAGPGRRRRHVSRARWSSPARGSTSASPACGTGRSARAARWRSPARPEAGRSSLSCCHLGPRGTTASGDQRQGRIATG